MGNQFSGSEIVEIGIQIEINGRDFYNTLVDKSKIKKAKEMFRYFSGEEEKHIDIFKGLLNSVSKYEPQEAYPQEYFSYMHALAGDHVFTQKDKGTEIAKKITTDLNAVEMAKGFEKDSIVFYEAMKKMVPEKDQKIMDRLIEEEQKHFNKLSDLEKEIVILS